MSQGIYANINPATTSGNQLAVLLNDFKDAVASGFSGIVRPPNLQPGGYWIDVTNAPTSWAYKIWNGTVNITVFTMNLATGTASFAGASGQFEISQVSADVVGPVLKLLKERIANMGQVLDDDVLGAIEIYGHANDGSTPLVARIKSVSSDNMTAALSGGYLVFEATVTGQTGLSEMMRLVDGKLGIGVLAPTHGLHSALGVKSEEISDTVNGATIVQKKSRATGVGQVLSGDQVSLQRHTSTDDNGDEIEAALAEVVATQNHTSTQAGSRYSLYTTDTGAAVPTEQMRISTLFATFFKSIKAKGLFMAMVSDGASAGNDQALAEPTSFATVFTGALNSILSIAAPTEIVAAGMFVHLNSTGGDIVYRNGASIRTGTGADLRVKSGASIFLIYDVVGSIWTIVGGSGSGGGISTTDIVSIDITDSPYTVQATDKIILVDASGGNVTVVLPNADAFAEVREVDVKRKDTDEDKIVTVVPEDVMTDDIDGEDAVVLLPKETVKFRQEAINQWGVY